MQARAMRWVPVWHPAEKHAVGHVLAQCAELGRAAVVELGLCCAAHPSFDTWEMPANGPLSRREVVRKGDNVVVVSGSWLPEVRSLR